MIYQYDQALPLPTKDLYDTPIMQMALSTAKDMYDRGEKRIDDFYEKYGDFFTPIAKDQETYNSYINDIRNTVNDLYARGIDPLRSAEGRHVVADAIRKFPREQVANIKQSAKNAEMFNKAKLDLMRAGLYNPDMDPYNGGTPEDWDTVGSGKIFDVMSPTPYKDLASFSEPYFKGLKPNIKNTSKNGISYNIESITEDDLRKVADAKYNDLINTQQGRLMYMRYKDLAGGDENVARQMFNDAIVDANKWRTYVKDNYDDNYYQQKQLWLAEQKFKHDVEKDAADLQFKRDQLAANLKIAEMHYGGNGSGSRSSSSSGGGSSAGEYKDDEYQLARSVSGAIASTQAGIDLGILDYSDFDEDAMEQTWPLAYQEIVDDVYGDFMNKYNLRPQQEIRPASRSRIGFASPKLYVDENGQFQTTPVQTNKLDSSLLPGQFTGSISPASMKSIPNYNAAKKELQKYNQNFINRLSTNYDASKFTEWVHKPVSSGPDKNMIIITNDEDAISRLHTIDELALNSFGINFEDIKGRFENEDGSIENITADIISTKSLRKAAKKQDGLRMKSISKVVPILDKDGVTHLYQLVQLFGETPGRSESRTSYNKFNNGQIYAYDMGIVTQRNPNFGLANNISSNLYLDENRDADTRQMGNMKVNSELKVSNTAVKSSPFIFPWQQ